MAPWDYLTEEAAAEHEALIERCRALWPAMTAGDDTARKKWRIAAAVAMRVERDGLRLDADPDQVPPDLLGELVRRLQARVAELEAGR